MGGCPMMPEVFAAGAQGATASCTEMWWNAARGWVTLLFSDKPTCLQLLVCLQGMATVFSISIPPIQSMHYQSDS